MIRGEKRKPLKIGTVRTVNMQTGEAVSERRNAMTLMPCAPDVCQECAVDHPHDAPHNQQSIYYQMSFHATHGRWPTWSDAMAHCAPDVQTRWRAALIEELRAHGQRVPDDLMDPKPVGR